LSVVRSPGHGSSDNASFTGPRYNQDGTSEILGRTRSHHDDYRTKNRPMSVPCHPQYLPSIGSNPERAQPTTQWYTNSRLMVPRASGKPEEDDRAQTYGSRARDRAHDDAGRRWSQAMPVVLPQERNDGYLSYSGYENYPPMALHGRTRYTDESKSAGGYDPPKARGHLGSNRDYSSDVRGRVEADPPGLSAAGITGTHPKDTGPRSYDRQRERNRPQRDPNNVQIPLNLAPAIERGRRYEQSKIGNPESARTGREMRERRAEISSEETDASSEDEKIRHPEDRQIRDTRRDMKGDFRSTRDHSERRRHHKTKRADEGGRRSAHRDRYTMLEREASKEQEPFVRGILNQPGQILTEPVGSLREGIVPRKSPGVPPDPRGTKIARRIVNPAALKEAREIFEEMGDDVIVYRVLTIKEIQVLANQTAKIRGKFAECDMIRYNSN
jgi:hypothetical protein